jgi:uncharacterized RDD family membrane protein YckC
MSAERRPPAADELVEIHARPAALWRRAIALAIDTVDVLAVLALYLFIALAIAGKPVGGTQMTGLDAWMARAQSIQTILVPGLLLAAVLAVAYSAAFGFLCDGRTPGRLVTGIRLVDQSGLAPAPARAILRAFLAVLSFAIFLGGFWLALVDRRGQTLHDKLTRTLLVQRTS